MDILFIHGNYPAQFVHLAQRLGQDGKHRVVFLTKRDDPEAHPLKGVTVRKFALHRDLSPEGHHYLQATEGAVLTGQAVVRELLKLKAENFHPKLVIFHGGNGLGLFLRQLMPNARIVAYLEWWFTDKSNHWLQENCELNDQLRAQMRNGITLIELDQSDIAITATEWQRSQFPAHHHSKIQVIFDGVDTSFYYPGTVEGECVLQVERSSCNPLILKRESRVLSYATRGMEPVRGFPEFMRMLPDLLSLYDDLEVVIAGRDRAAYSYQAPGCDGSWKQWMLKEIEPLCDLSRIHFTGLLNYGDYRKLLWRTDLHAYFSRSYITSWGLFQAAACGTPLLLNQDSCIDYVFDNDDLLKGDLDDLNSLAALAAQQLDCCFAKKQSSLSLLLPQFKLEKSMELWQALLRRLLS